MLHPILALVAFVRHQSAPLYATCGMLLHPCHLCARRCARYNRLVKFQDIRTPLPILHNTMWSCCWQDQFKVTIPIFPILTYGTRRVLVLPHHLCI